MKKIKLNYLQLCLFILIPSIITFILGGSLVYSRLNNTGKVTTTNNKYVNEFTSTYNKLLDEYYEDLDENKLIDAGAIIRGIVYKENVEILFEIDDLEKVQDFEFTLIGEENGNNQN